MKTNRVIALFGMLTLIIGASGCISQAKYDDIKSQNRIQQDRIASLESQLGDCNMTLGQKDRELQALSGQGGADIDAKKATIAALEADLENKKSLIAKMQAQLLLGGAPLPMELNVMLQEFAKTSDMISFDESTGSLKFKSDLLFPLGSDEVGAPAAEAIKALCGIMNASEGKQFDMVIVGHTDDMPIKRPGTRESHPTNWHLSVHRAISVLSLMTQDGIASERMCVKGYGEYKPVEPNKPNKGGSAANRRVEIFIIPNAAAGL